MTLDSILLFFFPSRQPASKKGGPVKPSAKKDGSGKETSKLTEAPEDVEVNLLSVYHGSVTFIGPDDK